MGYKKIPAFGGRDDDKFNLFSGNRSRLLLTPFHADRRPFNFQVGAGTYFQLDGTILVHFIDRSMNTGNGNDLIAFLQAFLEGFSLLGFLSLGPDHEKIENKDHTSEKQQLHHSGVGGGL
jgi:hypothetical protein